MSQRNLCFHCLKPRLTCYCSLIRPFRTKIQFLILQHPVERRRTIGTARMAHLCMENSKIIVGREFDHNKVLNEWISDPQNYCVVLYPGPRSQNISQLEVGENWYPPGKNLVVLVIDGTWTSAKSMLRKSPNLQLLPQICFTPTRKSEYRFRQQPEDHCLSTLEAIHQIVGILDPEVDASCLLDLFRAMVQQQIDITSLNVPDYYLK